MSSSGLSRFCSAQCILPKERNSDLDNNFYQIQLVLIWTMSFTELNRSHINVLLWTEIILSWTVSTSEMTHSDVVDIVYTVLKRISHILDNVFYQTETNTSCSGQLYNESGPFLLNWTNLDFMIRTVKLKRWFRLKKRTIWIELQCTSLKYPKTSVQTSFIF